MQRNRCVLPVSWAGNTVQRVMTDNSPGAPTSPPLVGVGVGRRLSSCGIMSYGRERDLLSPNL